MPWCPRRSTRTHCRWWSSGTGSARDPRGHRSRREALIRIRLPVHVSEPPLTLGFVGAVRSSFTVLPAPLVVGAQADVLPALSMVRNSTSVVPSADMTADRSPRWSMPPTSSSRCSSTCGTGSRPGPIRRCRCAPDAVTVTEADLLPRGRAAGDAVGAVGTVRSMLIVLAAPLRPGREKVDGCRPTWNRTTVCADRAHRHRGARGSVPTRSSRRWSRSATGSAATPLAAVGRAARGRRHAGRFVQVVSEPPESVGAVGAVRSSLT